MQGATTTSKLWGSSTLVSRLKSTHVYHCSVVRGGFSSIHSHRAKSNIFVVSSGIIRIELFEPKSIGVPVSSIQLSCSSQPYTIPPGIVHRFWAIGGRAEFIEIDHVSAGEVDPADITRFQDGGVDARNIHHTGWGRS